MPCNTVRGKALLAITREDDSHWDRGKIFHIRAHIQTPSNFLYAAAAQEDLECPTYDEDALPNAARKLDIGDKIVVAITYEIQYIQDYWGEWDVIVTYTKQRVLRKQLYRRNKCK